MLGISAITFFIFGLMVGSLNHPEPDSTDPSMQISVSGTVRSIVRNTPVVDAGAVVILLPETPSEVTRQTPSTIQPDAFQPLENPTIDHIRAQGGDIVRANVAGKFELYARPGKYFLLVISKSLAGDEISAMSRQQVANLSQYFIPVEDLIGSRGFYWEAIEIYDLAISRDEILIER